MLVLGIESSCDETAAAIVEEGTIVRSSTVASQDDLHRRFGGVVPELASRRHITQVIPVLESALSKAGVTISDIGGIAATKGPGLIGSLLVGFSFGKALAAARKIPMVGVHHIEGHLASVLLGRKSIYYPFIGLVVSGGHTNLYLVPSPGKYELLGQSIDDAAGEAFDKVAKLCGLGYPGGPAVDRAAKEGDPHAVDLPRAIPRSLDFSFSGLKTAVAQWVNKNGVPTGAKLADLMASFQQAVVDVLIAKLFEAAERHDIHTVAVCGGVARNSALRARLDHEVKSRDVELWLTLPEYCTDNAAMIAAAGYPRLARGEVDDFTLNATATFPLGI